MRCQFLKRKYFINVRPRGVSERNIEGQEIFQENKKAHVLNTRGYAFVLVTLLY
jgi:hypothetical protein